MSDRSKVIWSEGLFLRPHHFQQQERYFESYVEGRAGSLRAHGWGFEELELDRDVLAIGKLSIRRARGVFPDGTPFSIPDRDPAPAPLEVPAGMRNTRVQLALPLRRGGALDSDRRPGTDSLARQHVREIDLRDVTSDAVTTAVVEVGGLRLRLLPDGSPSDDFACIPLARVLECRPDRQLLLDDRFMPSALRVRACPPLATFLSEFYGLLHQRGDALAQVVTGNAAGVADLRSFLRFQAINRYEPLVQHLSQLSALHPEDLFRWLLVIAGDLAGLGQDGRRPALFPAYEQHDLNATFEPTIAKLRAYLDDKIVSGVVAIKVEQRTPNAFLAAVEDLTLIDSATFYLAVKAELPENDLRRRIPQITTVSPVVKLRELVEGLLPGLTLSPLAQLPPQLPFYAGHVYFAIDRSGPLWQDMKGSGAFGLWVGEALPNLSLSMWAIRGG